MEEALLGSAGLLVAGAITPGPNNFVVLREATRVGWRGVLPAIAGIVSGGIALLLLSAFGLGAVLATRQGLARATVVLGCLYLTLLGLRLLASHLKDDEAEEPEEPAGHSLPAGPWGLFVFQFLNPKAWAVVLTVTASATAEVGVLAAIPPLVVLYVVVPVSCLALWSWVGVRLRQVLETGSARVWLDRATGLSLVASAVLLLTTIWR